MKIESVTFKEALQAPGSQAHSERAVFKAKFPAIELSFDENLRCLKVVSPLKDSTRTITVYVPAENVSSMIAANEQPEKA